MLQPNGSMNMVEFDENDGYFFRGEYRYLRDNPFPEGWYLAYNDNINGYVACFRYSQFYGGSVNPTVFFKYDTLPVSTCAVVRTISSTMLFYYFVYSRDLGAWKLEYEDEDDILSEISDITDSDDSDDSEYAVDDDSDDDGEDATDYSDMEFGERHETIGIL